MGQPFALGGETIRVTIQDELGRIDLNAADGSLLNQLLRSAGMAKEAADTLTAQILDWRMRAAQPDTTGRPARLDPGGSQFCAPKTRAYGLFRHRAIDTAVAPHQALLAYYPNQPERVAALLKNRPDPASAGAFPGTMATGTSLSARTFDVIVELPAHRHAAKREAVIMLTNSLDKPFLVMAWR